MTRTRKGRGRERVLSAFIAEKVKIRKREDVRGRTKRLSRRNIRVKAARRYRGETLCAEIMWLPALQVLAMTPAELRQYTFVHKSARDRLDRRRFVRRGD